MALLLVAPLGAEIFEQVLVKVNGEIITKSEFEQRQVAELRNRPELGNVSPSSPQLRTAINEITPDLILTAVDELLLIQRGRELGYVMGDEQFNNILSSIKKQNNLDDEQKFQAALKQEGLTLADLRRNLERNDARDRRCSAPRSTTRSASTRKRRAPTTTRTRASSPRRPSSRCASCSSRCRRAIAASTWPRTTRPRPRPRTFANG